MTLSSSFTSGNVTNDFASNGCVKAFALDDTTVQSVLPGGSGNQLRHALSGARSPRRLVGRDPLRARNMT